METTNNVVVKWNEIKNEIQKKWSKLSPEELGKTKGDKKAVKVLIQRTYAEDFDTSGERLDVIFNQYSDEKTTNHSVS